MLAKFFLTNGRALYKYFWEIADNYRATGQLPSENESTVIQIFLGDYINTRLCHLFMVEAGDPFLKFIDFFESRKVRVHLIYPKTILLLEQHLSFFLQTGGRDNLTTSQLLGVDFRDPKLQLGTGQVFLGSGARTFIQKMGLTSSSPELAGFFSGVTRWVYMELNFENIQFFPGTTMKVLQPCSSM